MEVITSREDLNKIKKPVSAAIGIFDGIHRGHYAVLQKALEESRANNLTSVVLTFRSKGCQLPSSKNSDEQISSKSLFLGVLEDLGVDVVILMPFEEIRHMSPEEFVKEVLIDDLGTKFISCGIDFHFGKNAAGTWKDLHLFGKKYGMVADAVPIVMFNDMPISSTRIRHALSEGEIPEANDMMGHRYAIDFEVVGGNRIGRTLGTPTINQPYPEGFAVPKLGVYATLTKVDQKWYTSVTSVGTKPTIGDYDVLAETYIQDYSGNLYGKNIEVQFLQFLRKEIKYDSIEELRAQILRDSEEAKMIGSLYL